MEELEYFCLEGATVLLAAVQLRRVHGDEDGNDSVYQIDLDGAGRGELGAKARLEAANERPHVGATRAEELADDQRRVTKTLGEEGLGEGTEVLLCGGAGVESLDGGGEASLRLRLRERANARTPLQHVSEVQRHVGARGRRRGELGQLGQDLDEGVGLAGHGPHMDRLDRVVLAAPFVLVEDLSHEHVSQMVRVVAVEAVGHLHLHPGTVKWAQGEALADHFLLRRRVRGGEGRECQRRLGRNRWGSRCGGHDFLRRPLAVDLGD
mmetsp:Transcript_4950/g.10872  ORF Transcript_4950/g.10872 Transcript_4950/m.10872 type:complete len:266 (-) Transcript_4950:610-1407(-)